VNVNWRGAAVKNGSKLNCIKIFRISVHFVRYLPCFLFACEPKMVSIQQEKKKLGFEELVK